MIATVRFALAPQPKAAKGVLDLERQREARQPCVALVVTEETEFEKRSEAAPVGVVDERASEGDHLVEQVGQHAAALNEFVHRLRLGSKRQRDSIDSGEITVKVHSAHPHSQ